LQQSSTEGYINMTGSGGLNFRMGSGFDTRMTIDSSGNVGIGTDSPVVSSGYNSLTINDTTSGYLVLQNNGTTKMEAYVSGGTEATLRGTGVPLAFVTTAAHDMTFDTNATERMRIDSSGNVGIGTTNPTSKLHVLDASTTWAAQIQNTNGTDGSALIVRSDSTNDPVVLGCYGNGSYRLVVRADGKVGIGSGSSGSLSTALEVSGDSSGVTNNITTYNASTTSSAEASVDWSLERTGSAAKIRAARISAGKEQTWTTTASTVDGYLRFLTCQNESLGERMRIDSSGNLLVGTTSTTQDTSNFGTRIGGTDAPGYLASYRDVSGTTVAVRFGGNAGQVYVRGDGDLENTNNNYGAISDERLKSNIVDASSQIDDIMAVQVRSYTLNETGDTHIGVVAQELEASGMSGLVKTDDEGMKSVKYSILYVKAIKALQEAVTRIETLEAEVAALKGA